MTKPILLLDVDGVLNGLGGPEALCPDWKWNAPFHSSLESGGFKLTLSREMGDAIRALDLDVRWLTTWREHANPEVGARLGWGLLPVANREVEQDRFGSLVIDRGKGHAAKVLLANPGPPVVWIDDDAPWIGVANLDPHGRLVATIQPDYLAGLSRAEIDRVRDVLGQQTDAP